MPLLIAAFRIITSSDTGSIEGIVTNQYGPVASAAVEARNIMSGTVARIETEADGRYVLAGLRPGRYSLCVEAKNGDAVWIPRVIVESGQVAHQDIYLGSTSRSTAGSEGPSTL